MRALAIWFRPLLAAGCLIIPALAGSLFPAFAQDPDSTGAAEPPAEESALAPATPEPSALPELPDPEPSEPAPTPLDSFLSGPATPNPHAPRRGTSLYEGPLGLSDPADPLQQVNWTLGRYIPRRNRLGMGSRQVKRHVTYDMDRDVVLIAYQAGAEVVLPNRAMTTAQYVDFAVQDELRQIWIDSNRRVVAEGQNQGQGGINLNLGVELPFTEKLFGPGAPNLNVSGSQQLTFSGTSSWVKDQVTGERGGGSLFPKLEMRQRLDVSLQGTIGTKLFVDVRQNSEALTPLENAIQIRYRGEEDEVIQNIELGNTNLTLPRTQFVSVSARTEGLFGIKANGQVGDILWTGIASRQEGETGTANFSGGGQVSSRTVQDNNFQARRYFLLYDPNEPIPTIVDGSLRVYLDDRNLDNNNELGARTARVWLTPGLFDDAGNLVDPVAAGIPTYDVTPDVPYRGWFHLLNPVEDYNIFTNDAWTLPYLELRSPLSPDQVMAVSYVIELPQGGTVRIGNTVLEADSLDLRMIRPGVGVDGWEADLTQGPWAPARRLELKNVYNLGGRNLDANDFELAIEIDGGGNNAVVLTNEFGETTSLLEVLGLDQRDNLVGDRFEPDGKVDPEYIDYENGLLFFPDFRPFDPEPEDIAGPNPLDFAVQGAVRLRERSWPIQTNAHRPDTLGWTFDPAGATAYEQIAPSSQDAVERETVPGIYDLRSDVLSSRQATNHKYNIVSTFRSAVSTIRLNALGDILPNSETVTLDGRPLVAGQDYRINYELGEVELLNEEARLPGAQLDVSYSFDSPFSRGSRSLMGMNLTRNAPRDAAFSYSTSWLHESRGVPDRRPRLGQEPTKTTVGDLAAQYNSTPWGLTRLVDKLPFVRSTAPSRFSLSGAVGLSFPNPNTKDIIYIDDMEGAETVTSASINRTSWFYSSAPARAVEYVGDVPLDVTPEPTDRGSLLWFSPQTVRVRDINPREDASSAANDLVSALEIVYAPYERAGVNGSWGGLSAPLSFDGVDLTESQFIEIWINDFKGYDNKRHERRGEVLIDIGTVSEDALWDPLTPPAPANGRLDREDSNSSGGRIELLEDTGLDGLFSSRNVPSGESVDSVETADPDDIRTGFGAFSRDQDPLGDDRLPEVDTRLPDDTLAERVAKFRGINGTERNEFSDSEDLNDDAALNVANNYSEYRIDLTSEALTDNGRDFPPPTDLSQAEIDENGWRLYRIPINDVHLQVGSTDLSLVKHIRLWFRGIDPGDTLDVQIANIEIAGNRWELTKELPNPNTQLGGEEFQVAVVNNKETPDYFSPFQVERINNQQEREQSISLEFTNFGADNELRAVRSLQDVRDYTLYRNFSFYVNPRFALMDTLDQVEFYIRFGSNQATDSLSYYEVSTILTENDPRRTPPSFNPSLQGWIPFTIPVSELSTWKLGFAENTPADSFLVGPGDDPDAPGRPRGDIGNGLKVTVRGMPSMSRVRRLIVGVRNKAGHDLIQGEVWYDELTMGEVRRDTGVAATTSASVVLADLGTVNAGWALTSADFLRLGVPRGSGNNVRSFNINTSLGLHKFVEGLGVNAPFRWSTRSDKSVPKFQPNSDIEYTGDLDSGTDITQRSQSTMSLNLSRRPLGPQSPILRYTLDAMSFSGAINKSRNTLPTQVDTTESRTGSISYGLNFGNVAPFRLLKRLDFYLLPRSVSAGLNGGTSKSRRYVRDLGQTALTVRDSTSTKTGMLNLNANFQPLRVLNYTYAEQRDLIDAHFGADTSVVRTQTQEGALLGIPTGRRVNQSHSLNFNYTPPFAGAVRPRFTWTSGSTINSNPANTSARAESTIVRVNNNNTANFSLNIPLGRALSSFFRPGDNANQNQARPQPANPGTIDPNRPRARQPGRGAAAADSTREEEEKEKKGGSIKDQLRPFFTNIVRFADIQGSYQVRKSNTVGGIHGTVPLAYKLGLSQDFGLGSTAFPVFSAGSFNQSFSDGKTYRGTSSLTLLREVKLDMTYQRITSSTENGLGATARLTKDTTWPEIRFNWGTLHEKIPFLGNLFRDFRPTATSYRKQTTVTGTSDKPDESTSTATSWQPLISIQGTLKWGWSTTLSTDRTSVESVSARIGSQEVRTVTKTANYRVGLKRTFTRQTGGRRRDINLDIDFTYNTNTRRTEAAFVQEDQNTNLTLSTAATLPFTRTISGTFRLNFAQARQPNRGFTRSSLGLQFQTGFRF